MHVDLDPRAVPFRRAIAGAQIETTPLAIFAWMVAIALLLRSTFTPDTYFSLYAGRLDASGLPQRDALTVLAYGRSAIDQQWLAHRLLFGAHELCGGAGVALLAALCVGIAFALFAKQLRRHGARGGVFVLLLLLAVVGAAANMPPRAQTLALPLFVVVLDAALRERVSSLRTGQIALTGAAIVIWANVHGSVLLAALFFAVGAVVASVRRDRALRAWGCAIGAALCCLASPYGVDLISYYRSLVGNSALAAVSPEWAPAGLTTQSLGIWCCVAACLALVGARSRVLVSREPLLTIVCAILAVAAIQSIRMGIWLGFATPMLLARVLPVASIRPLPRALTRPALPLGLLLAALSFIFAFSGARHYDALAPVAASSAAAAAAAERPSIRVLADVATVGELLWSHPELGGRVAFDVRLELLKATELRALQRYFSASGRDWERAADGYGIVLLALPERAVLARRLAHSVSFRRLFADTHGAVFVRTQRG